MSVKLPADFVPQPLMESAMLLFYDCPKLTSITMYYGPTILAAIGEDAFWRESDCGDTLQIGYIIGYPDATVPFHTYDWKGSNRLSLLFTDVYGTNLNASVIGTCPSCGQNSLQGTYVSETHTAKGHERYNECYLCHYTQSLGTYVYKSHGDGSAGSWTCPSCGSHSWVLNYERDATCTSNGYRSYSCACGQSKTETVYATGHSYSYGSWSNSSASQHRRSKTCSICGETSYEYASHSLSYGSWSKSSDTQHSRVKSCSACGYSGTEYGDHSYTYGSWTSHDAAQHMRKKSCSVCGDGAYEYGDHTDTNADGQCDACGYAMAATLTWDYGDGKTETTSQPINAKLVLPTEPTKDDYTFSGWFTDKTGGERVDGETVFTADSPTTYYAQWAKIEVFSVTVPVSLPVIADENGEVHTASAGIVNNSTGAVKVSGLTLTAKNGWTLVPYDTDMAHAKVDAKQIGFQINGEQTTETGSEETFSFSAPWSIPENGTLPLTYGAVVSAVSQPVTGQEVLSVVFVLEWKAG